MSLGNLVFNDNLLRAITGLYLFWWGRVYSSLFTENVRNYTVI